MAVTWFIVILNCQIGLAAQIHCTHRLHHHYKGHFLQQNISLWECQLALYIIKLNYGGIIEESERPNGLILSTVLWQNSKSVTPPRRSKHLITELPTDKFLLDSVYNYTRKSEEMVARLKINECSGKSSNGMTQQQSYVQHVEQCNNNWLMAMFLSSDCSNLNAGCEKIKLCLLSPLSGASRGEFLQANW